MRAFKNFGFLLTLFAVFALVSCEDDGTGGGGTGGGGTNDGFPTVSVTGPGVNLDLAFGVTDTFTYTITATEGDSPLNDIRVTEDDVDVPFERVLWDGQLVSNPVTLANDNKSALTIEVGVIVTGIEVGTKTYKIILRDDELRNTETEFTVTTAGLPPTLDFTTMMSGAVTIGVNALQSYPLTAAIGSSNLATMTVLENGVGIEDLSRVEWDGATPAANPFAIGEGNETGFDSKTLFIRSSATEGVNDYQVIITDENGLTSTLDFTITTEIPKVDVAMGVLFNSAGPAGTGGLDLDGALGTGSMSDLAEIRDLGLDANDNWLRQIATVNNSQIRYIIAGQNGVSESFTFDGVENKEEVPALFANGQDYGNETVLAGDVFGVERDGVFYLIRIASVNEVTADNSDNYVVDIKK